MSPKRFVSVGPNLRREVSKRLAPDGGTSYASYPNSGSDLASDVYRMTITLKRLWIFLIAIACWAGATPPKVPDCRIEFEKTVGTLIVLAFAQGGFHFNRQAPTELLMVEQPAKFTPSRIENQRLEFVVPAKNPFSRGIRFEAFLYICDDAENVCIPQHLMFAWKGIRKAKTAPASLSPADRIVIGKNAEGFVLNDPAAAFSQARREHKPLMIVFSTIWCPYCNQLEEEIYPTPEFQSVAKKFVLLWMDGDTRASWELGSRYPFDGFPTIVFTTPSGDEITRFAGSGSARLLPLMRKALDEKDVGFAELKRRADKGEAKAAQSVGETLFDREEYPEAEKYLRQASKHFGPKSSATESLLRVQIEQMDKTEGKKAEEEKETLLKKAIAEFPQSPYLWNYHRFLAKLYKKEKKPTQQKEQLLAANQKGQELLSDEAGRKVLDETVERLWDLLGDIRRELGDAKGAKEAYGEAVRAARLRIDRLGTKNPARGSHLILAELLVEAGEISEAQKIFHEYQVRYPEEATFFIAEAEMLQHLKKYGEAEPKAEMALAHSYGDNRLNAAKTLAEILASLGRNAEAVRVIDETLKEFEGLLKSQSSLDPTKVRTGWLLKKLQTLKKQIQEGSFKNA